MDTPVVEKVGKLVQNTVSVTGTAVVNLAVGQIYNNIGNCDESDIVEITAIDTDDTQSICGNEVSTQIAIEHANNDSDIIDIEVITGTHDAIQTCDEINEVH